MTAAVNPLGRLHLLSEIVAVALAAGGEAEGVIVAYRGANGARMVSVRLLADPQIQVWKPLAEVRPTGRTVMVSL